MKQLFLILMISTPFFSTAHSGEQSAVFNGIISAFKSGNAATLSNFFDTEVEIAVFDKDNIYSKAQAKTVMQKFFAKHKPTSFTKEHEGTSPSGSNYCIGILKASTGTYRVFIHAKEAGGKKIIQQIQIERE
jgi:hypothetical protein